VKTLFGLCLLALSVYGQLASAFMVYRPDGIVDVQPSGSGFNIIDLRKNEITSVTKSGNGYVIFPEKGEPTFIEMGPEDEQMERDILLPMLLDDEVL
jgi:hypothetical protein